MPVSRCGGLAWWVGAVPWARTLCHATQRYPRTNAWIGAVSSAQPCSVRSGRMFIHSSGDQYHDRQGAGPAHRRVDPDRPV